MLDSCTHRNFKLLVEIDLQKPLIRGTNLSFEEEKRWVTFKYEHLPLLCFYCGRIRYGERSCERKMNDLKILNRRRVSLGSG